MMNTILIVATVALIASHAAYRKQTLATLREMNARLNDLDERCSSIVGSIPETSYLSDWMVDLESSLGRGTTEIRQALAGLLELDRALDGKLNQLRAVLQSDDPTPSATEPRPDKPL